MTHSLSTFDAERPPAMYRSATLAIVVSSTSMNVGMTTATATSQGLIDRRPTAVEATIALVILGRDPLWRTARCDLATTCSNDPDRSRTTEARFGRRRGRRGFGDAGGRLTLRERQRRLQVGAGVRSRSGLVVVHVRYDRQTDEEGHLVRIVVGQLDPYRQSLNDLHVIPRG